MIPLNQGFRNLLSYSFVADVDLLLAQPLPSVP